MRVMTPQLGKLERRLQHKILRHLRTDGYRIENGILTSPEFNDKDAVRQVYARYRWKLLDQNRNWIEQLEPQLLQWFANGEDIVPERINPALVPVKSELERKLFTYASLLWSVPPSAGYGRRLRYLVIDQSNSKLIGILGLCDPVLGLRARDEWIGWTTQQRWERLWHVMDVYALGAVPPYSFLLGGKLVAMLAASNEVRRDFKVRYAGKPAVISGRVRPPYLVLLTTTGALGRSSLLNRLKFRGRLLWQPVGWTQGQGHFRFLDGLFDDMLGYLKQKGDPLVYKYKFGGGPNWRMRVIRTCLQRVGLDRDSFLNHGIRRQVFAAELTRDAREFLRGEIQQLHFYNLAMSELVSYFKERWLLPRAERDRRFREFKKDSIRLSHIMQGGQEYVGKGRRCATTSRQQLAESTREREGKP